MNYEKFNDAMCRLRQAEENLNKALQGVYAAINEVETKDEADLRVGDEILCINVNGKNYDEKFIYLGRNGWRIVLCRLKDGELQYTTKLKNYQKTGKHYNINF